MIVLEGLGELPGSQENLNLIKRLIKFTYNMKVSPKRVLVLHGYGQTLEKIKKSADPLRKLLSSSKEPNSDRFELVYVQASNPVINLKGENGYAWFTPSPDEFFTCKNYNVTESINTIKNFIEGSEFDGLIGFSQGGVMASILLKEKIISPKWAIIIGTFYASDPKYQDYSSITIPTLHIWGERDSIVLPQQSEENYNHYTSSNKMCYIHKGCHVIPVTSQDKEIYKKFIFRFGVSSELIDF